MTEIREIKDFLHESASRVLRKADGIPRENLFREIALQAENRLSRSFSSISFVKFHPGDPARVTFLISPSYGEPSSFMAQVPFPYWSEYQPSLFGGRNNV